MNNLILLCVFLAVCHGKPAVNSNQFNVNQAMMIDYINNLNTTWKASALNKIFLSNIHSVDSERSENRELLPIKRYVADDVIPHTFDARSHWHNCTIISQIPDEGHCRSGWALAGASAISDRICIASNQTVNEAISGQDVLTCCGEDICGISNCFAGHPSGPWRMWKSKGIVTGGLYQGTGCLPYSTAPCAHFNITSKLPWCPALPPTPGCLPKCVPSSGQNYETDRVYAKELYSLYGAEDIQRDIFLNGPVSATFWMHSDFISYKSGVYKKSVSFEHRLWLHTVKILGWGEENNVPYWLAANTWNKEFGEKGLFKIIRGQDECGIETIGVYAGVPK